MDKNTPFVTCLTNAYEEIVKDGKKPYVMGGGTYARKIPNAVGFGPGLQSELGKSRTAKRPWKLSQCG